MTADNGPQEGNPILEDLYHRGLLDLTVKRGGIKFEDSLDIIAVFDPKGERIVEWEEKWYEFQRLKMQWKKETVLTGSMTEIVGNKNYQDIINLGQYSLAFILNELRTDPDWWFSALHEITGQNPINDEDSGNLEKMTKSWLEWWKNKNGE